MQKNGLPCARFSARVGSGVFSTVHEDTDVTSLARFQCPCGLWGLFYKIKMASVNFFEGGFSARVGSGVFSTLPLSQFSPFFSSYRRFQANKWPPKWLSCPFFPLL